ncbi:MAG: O-acetyl-ADP-ribose deacetylase [Spirochaetota bacterium]|nr:O-acetyl-ADP-ribose deacetylase [Spirochaetota bacterium]
MKDILNYIKIKQGDITEENTDAIVNAANTSLLGGGGVDGAIHRAAGPQLLEECRGFGECRPGEARITKGYKLKAKHVIHTPGPIYKGGRSRERETLEHSYFNSMKLAKEYNLKSIAFPAISTGVYSYPKEEACEVAITTVINFIRDEDYVMDVNFVLFDKSNFDLYNNYINRLNNELS